MAEWRWTTTNEVTKGITVAINSLVDGLTSIAEGTTASTLLWDDVRSLTALRYCMPGGDNRSHWSNTVTRSLNERDKTFTPDAYL